MIGRETYELTRLYWLGYSGGVDTFWYFVVSLKAVPLFRWCNLFPHFFDIKSKLSVITMKKSLLLVVERERRSMLFPFCRNSRVAALVPGILFLSEFRFLCTYVYTFNSFIYFPSFFFSFSLLFSRLFLVSAYIWLALLQFSKCVQWMDGWISLERTSSRIPTQSNDVDTGWYQRWIWIWCFNTPRYTLQQYSAGNATIRTEREIPRVSRVGVSVTWWKIFIINIKCMFNTSKAIKSQKHPTKLMQRFF